MMTTTTPVRWMHTYKCDNDDDSGEAQANPNGNVVKVNFIRCKMDEKVRQGEKYIINQSDSLILILLVFLDGI